MKSSRKYGGLLTAVLVILLVVSVLAGCGKPKEEGSQKQEGATEEKKEEGAAAPEQAKLKVALVLPGSINDAGWNAAAYNALMKLKQKGYEVSFMEKVAQADIESALRDFAARGYQVVFGHGFEFGDPVKKVAPDFPDTKFFVINGAVEGPNFASLRFANWETDYIIGILAAKMTKTNVLGCVAAFEIPSLVRPMEAFKLGAKSINPNIKIKHAFVGSWEDVNKAKEAALALIDQGADILHINADAAAHGALEAAKSRGVMAIGNTSDQNPLYPDTVLTSSLRNVDRMFELAIGAVEQGTFEGKVYLYGLKDGAVGWAPFHGFDSKIPQEVKDLMEKTKQDIIDGKIQVPQIDKPTE